MGGQYTHNTTSKPLLNGVGKSESQIYQIWDFRIFEFPLHFLYILKFDVFFANFPRYIAKYETYPICKTGATSVRARSRQPLNMGSIVEIKSNNQI